MDELEQGLRGAPRTAEPPRNLWLGVQTRLQPVKFVWWTKAAAVILIFVGGAVAGREFEKRQQARVVGTTIPADGFAAAADVQNTASAYLAALAQLHAIGANDEFARAQGYEAATNVLSVSAMEVTAALQLPGPGRELIAAADSLQSIVSRRVTELRRRTL